MISRKQNVDVGVILSLILLIIGWISGNMIWFRIAVPVLLATALIPVIYMPLSWLWCGFTRLTERLFTTVLLTLIFYLVVTPVALLRRCISKDSLHLYSFRKGRDSMFVVKDKTYKTDDLEKQY